MVTWSEKDPTVTLELLLAKGKTEFNKDVARTTDCRMITLKKLHLISSGMNNSNAKQRRIQ